MSDVAGRTRGCDRVALWRRRAIVAVAASLPMLGAIGWWASTASEVPLRLPPVPAGADRVASTDLGGPDPLEERAFARSLAPLLPLPPKEEAPPGAATGGVELLGIQRVGEVFVAILYDPREDRIRAVRSGDRLAGIEIARVEPREVTLVEAGAPRTIRIAERSPAGRTRTGEDR